MLHITLPNYPKTLPSNIDVRDFDLEDGRHARVVLELNPVANMGHFSVSAQAFEMDAAGSFVPAPLGYPSRCSGSTHTIIESALGDTVELGDAWVRHGGQADPATLAAVTAKPITAGAAYGDLVWDSGRNHAWRWAEGFADSTARAKVQDLLNVMNSSTVRSGLGFR